MVNLFQTTFILALMWVAMAGGQNNAPTEAPSPSETPSDDCSTLIYNMMDCMSFLSKGSDETKPEGTCCSGFKTVINTNADCICYALSSSASLGLDLDMAKAASLPSVCSVAAPPLSNCNLSSTPATSPANPPSDDAPPTSSPSVPPATQPPAAAPGGGAPPADVPSSPASSESPAAVPSGAAASQSPAPAPSRAHTSSIISSSVVFAVILISFSFLNA